MTSFLSRACRPIPIKRIHHLHFFEFDGIEFLSVKDNSSLHHDVMASLKKIWRDRRLSLASKIRTPYKTLVLSTFLYAAETWNLRTEDVRILDSLNMKCQSDARHQVAGPRPGMLMLQSRLVYPQSRNVAIAFLVTLPGCRIPSQSTKLCAIRPIRRSVDFLTNRGSIVSVVLASDVRTKSVTTTVVRS